MTWIRASYRAELAEEDGQALTEYAVILMLIALICIAILTTIGQTMNNVFYSAINGMFG